MRTGLLFLALLPVLLACRNDSKTVMARYVPERMDDFVFENERIVGRIYGKALEKETISPGIDIWVKMPGGLIADTLYHEDLDKGLSYHRFRGLGKDCYKVGCSLGAGASALLVDERIQYPQTNYRSYEILEQQEDRVTFVLHYPSWKAEGGITMALDKKITLKAGSHFAKAEDHWTFQGAETLLAAAGIYRHPKDSTLIGEWMTGDSYVLWEKASDTAHEPEDGLIGIAVWVPDATESLMQEDGGHGLVMRRIHSGETFTYYFGSCWSKGEIKTKEEWLNEVEQLRNGPIR